jgi:hypothetical protein
MIRRPLLPEGGEDVEGPKIQVESAETGGDAVL